VKAEAERHGGALIGDHAGGDAQSAGAHADRQLETVGEGEHRQQFGMRAEVELGGKPGAFVIAAAAGDAPRRRRGERAVDRQAVLLAVQQGRGRVQLDRAPGRLVAPAAETVGPGIQERDAEHGALLQISAQPAADAQQLLAAMPQRAPHHARTDGEPRHEVAPGSGQLDDPEVGRRGNGRAAHDAMRSRTYTSVPVRRRSSTMSTCSR
jgi:hypothetical protein